MSDDDQDYIVRTLREVAQESGGTPESVEKLLAAVRSMTPEEFGVCWVMLSGSGDDTDAPRRLDAAVAKLRALPTGGIPALGRAFRLSEEAVEQFIDLGAPSNREWLVALLQERVSNPEELEAVTARVRSLSPTEYVALVDQAEREEIDRNRRGG